MNLNLDQKDLVFGLDIGTRNVVGVVGFEEDQQFHIIEVAAVEHTARAMIDGQIHNIMKVAQTIGKVKENLETSLGTALSNVSIAAAGRVLKTTTITTYIDFEDEVVINKDYIESLHLRGVEKAQEEIKTNEEGNFFCVGHSIVKYYLDDYEIENLESHKGRRIGVHILATFLPQVVIDSLYTAVDKVKLSVDHLSLEPIAAINAAIPENYRLLNLALVDVGAGTSDIAITRGGSVVAYGMIPMAGDELTEQIVHRYLVDFDTAEKMKRQLNASEDILYKDILGMEHTLSVSELLKHLEPTMKQLTIKISEKLKELNNEESPNAVFCVGGGGLLPGFTSMLADGLDLLAERVVFKSTKDILNVVDHTESLIQPDMVTPVGICLTSLQERGGNFIEVTLNGRMLKLLKARKLTVMDAALKIGLTYKDLMPRKGKDLCFYVNDKQYKKRGKTGEPAQIFINKHQKSLSEPIHQDDVIEITRAENGTDANYSLNELIKEYQLEITVDGVQRILVPEMRINGAEVQSNHKLSDGDRIFMKKVENIGDLRRVLGILETITLLKGDYVMGNNLLLQAGDAYTTEASVQEATATVSIPHVERPETDYISSTTTTEFMEMWVMVNQEPVLLKGKKDYIFVDVFEYYDFDLTTPKGKVKLKLNGKEAAYTDSLHHQDQLEIYWE